MKNLVTTVVGVGLLVGTAAFGSGFKCEGEGYNVKLFNSTSFTRVPAVMVVSADHQGTLLRRTQDEITKRNRANSVQYVVDGNGKIDADTVVLQISFKEGRETLAEGEVTDGQLIIVKDGQREVLPLSCERYLKNS